MAAIVALIGVMSTALLISVLAQKLLLTRWEKYVHNFVLNIELAKNRKHQAANVIKFAIKTWYLKRKDKHLSLQNIRAQWKLVQSIHVLRQVKDEQRKLIDRCLVLADMFHLQRDGHDRIEQVQEDISTMKLSVDRLDEKFNGIHRTLTQIEDALVLVMERRT